MIVSGISTPWAGKVAPMDLRKISEVDYTNNPIFLKKGDEMGCFSLGSTAITLFEREITPNQRLEANKEVWMGESLGHY
jgi:phosphatidylserine decarboxylase